MFYIKKIPGNFKIQYFWYFTTPQATVLVKSAGANYLNPSIDVFKFITISFLDNFLFQQSCQQRQFPHVFFWYNTLFFFYKNVKFWVEPQGFLKIQILRLKMLLNGKLSLALPVSKFLKHKVVFPSKNTVKNEKRVYFHIFGKNSRYNSPSKLICSLFS